MFKPITNFAYVAQNDENGFSVINANEEIDSTYNTESLAVMRQIVLQKQYMKIHSDLNQPRWDGTITKDYIQR